MEITDERPDDVDAIRDIVREAFAGAEHSSGTEWKIVDALREGGALTISLVAVERDEIVGHVAVSPVIIDGCEGWYGLGPVAVRPGLQHKGIGSALVERVLEKLREAGAAGCVVLGDPGFYGKFGFVNDPGIFYADVPPPYFQVLAFESPRPSGRVEYHSAFEERA